ncbi:MAG: hypothetical protein ACKOD2_10480, partial [Ilumatobacteraceae bacterium]
MSSIAPSPAAPFWRRIRIPSLNPAEGWSVVIAHAVVLATTGGAMSNIPDAPGTSGLVVLAV